MAMDVHGKFPWRHRREGLAPSALQRTVGLQLVVAPVSMMFRDLTGSLGGSQVPLCAAIGSTLAKEVLPAQAGEDGMRPGGGVGVGAGGKDLGLVASFELRDLATGEVGGARHRRQCGLWDRPTGSPGACRPRPRSDGGNGAPSSTGLDHLR